MFFILIQILRYLLILLKKYKKENIKLGKAVQIAQSGSGGLCYCCIRKNQMKLLGV
jgi:hypothetical protein